jgi:hypothetical protein
MLTHERRCHAPLVRRLVTALVLVGLAALTGPTEAADGTADVVRLIRSCDPSAVSPTSLRVDVLLALADGRSARDLANILAGPSGCLGRVSAYGYGAEEMLLVGTMGRKGALLWVDHGWWRGANVNVGFDATVLDELRRTDGRELLVGIGSGGSAGVIGILGVRLAGAATVILDPGELWMEVSEARFINSDHIYVQGRSTRGYALNWQSHAGWPGGDQRLFARSGNHFIEASRRQALDPMFVYAGYVAGAFWGDAGLMSRFASGDAVASGLRMEWSFAQGHYMRPLRLLAGQDLVTKEWMSWDALPAEARVLEPSGPVWGVIDTSLTGYGFYPDRLVRFDRGTEGWVITAIVDLPLALAGGPATLVP